ncbi:Glycosyltransferase involved in cell wall bisynthesis [Salinimicrobium sediminis]|uniref:Glycosyltransferase involved in cell wall bisynthesis n=1 Tax=Salinimicrobium sediminis TaxID=1343891 RepID=A0A285WZT7_9FLAO|nr:glycosyltransferase family 2 protein [Salinimicrobium sediminis]SOC78568.1 Glycosyltransferase involved in cell wall bisynthesis [Salinimicrobium sediminis]
MNPLVSIIVPTYNRCAFLGETMDSILVQQYSNWECIIVDDGSTDYTKELVDFYCSKDERIKYFKRPDSLTNGANNCRNYGFAMSIGDYINWFDDDDVMLPDFLSERTPYMNQGVEVLICSFFPVDPLLSRKAAVSLKKSFSLFRSYALYELKLVTNSVLFNRKIFKDKILFVPGLKYGDETELFLRIFYREPEPSHIIINKPLFLYRQHDASKTKQNEKPDPAFRFSVMYVALQNLSRGIERKDTELINFYYKKLVSMFFRSLDTRQMSNSVHVLGELVPLVRRINFALSLELLFWGRIFIFIGKGSYKIEKRLKHFFD